MIFLRMAVAGEPVLVEALITETPDEAHVSSPPGSNTNLHVKTFKGGRSVFPRVFDWLG